MATKKDAKEAVVGIGKRYGFIDLDIMNRIQQWDPEVRRTIEESMLAKDRLAAHSITTCVICLRESGHLSLICNPPNLKLSASQRTSTAAMPDLSSSCSRTQMIIASRAHAQAATYLLSRSMSTPIASLLNATRTDSPKET